LHLVAYTVIRTFYRNPLSLFFKAAKQDYAKFGYDIPVTSADTKAAADKIN